MPVDHLHVPVRLCLGAVRGHARARAAGEVETAASARFSSTSLKIAWSHRDPFQNAEIYRVTPPDSFMLNASSCRTHFRRSPRNRFFVGSPPWAFTTKLSVSLGVAAAFFKKSIGKSIGFPRFAKARLQGLPQDEPSLPLQERSAPRASPPAGSIIAHSPKS